jgi:hypothetical protein
MEDDRKQRFRFHKEDEILLLNIVLRASPCPYNISSRDGAIMVAWNNIAEEFKSLCKPRPDGKVPHSRTCRTRCDKMIVDYLAMQASPQLRGKKLESKDDRIKNELVARLSALQGKGLDPNLIASAAEASASAGSGTGTGAGAGGDSPSNSDDPISNLSPAIPSTSGIPGSSELMNHVTGAASGSSLMTPGQVLGRASGNQGMNDSPLLSHTGHLQHHQQQHPQQHHQQQDHYQQHSHQQLAGHQAASELLAASALLLPTTMGGMHPSPHQNPGSATASTNIFATPNSTTGTAKVDKKGKQVVGSRKRRINNTTVAEVQAQQQQQPAPVSTASFEALQRQNLSNSTANTNTSQASVLPNTKRLRSAAKQSTSTTTTTAAMPTYTQQQSQQQQQQQVNSGRTMMGVLGHGVGSGFASNDLTGLSGLGSSNHNHGFPEIHSVHDFGDDNDDNDDDDQDDHNNIDDDDDDDDGDGGDTGFQDTQDAFDSAYDNNTFEHDLDGVSPASQMEASTLLSFQKGTSGGNSGNSGYRKNKNSRQIKMSDNNGPSSKSSSMRNKRSNSNGGGQQRYGSNNNNGNSGGGGGVTGLGFGAGAGGNGGGGGGGGGFGGMPMISTGFGAAGGFLQPSQLNADDRAYLMRTLALEEQRVKIEVDKVALEREKLALENRRLEWKMQQMNHQ